MLPKTLDFSNISKYFSHSICFSYHTLYAVRGWNTHRYALCYKISSKSVRRRTKRFNEISQFPNNAIQWPTLSGNVFKFSRTSMVQDLATFRSNAVRKNGLRIPGKSRENPSPFHWAKEREREREREREKKDDFFRAVRFPTNGRARRGSNLGFLVRCHDPPPPANAASGFPAGVRVPGVPAR